MVFSYFEAKSDDEMYDISTELLRSLKHLDWLRTSHLTACIQYERLTDLSSSVRQSCMQLYRDSFLISDPHIVSDTFQNKIEEAATLFAL